MSRAVPRQKTEIMCALFALVTVARTGPLLQQFNYSASQRFDISIVEQSG
jgi:hypothetical protein